MSDKMSDKKNAQRTDMILDLLAEELVERIRQRNLTRPAARTPAQPPPAPPTPTTPTSRQEKAGETTGQPPSPGSLAAPATVEAPPARIVGPPHAARLMGRLALLLLALIVVVNLPINCHGLTLATAMPDAQSLIIRDGLVVKEAGRDEIYVYEEGAFRWISSLDAFEHYGHTWDEVHIVQDGFLRQYPIGNPIHVLLKCQQSPHIYRLENGLKRWIVDINTFTAEGHVWDDVRFVPCEYLRGIPDGETIPPGRGPAPAP